MKSLTDREKDLIRGVGRDLESGSIEVIESIPACEEMEYQDLIEKVQKSPELREAYDVYKEQIETEEKNNNASLGNR